jgi:hypothetical protein
MRSLLSCEAIRLAARPTPVVWPRPNFGRTHELVWADLATHPHSAGIEKLSAIWVTTEPLVLVPVDRGLAVNSAPDLGMPTQE